RVLARHPPGRDRRRHRQLPQAPVHPHRGQQRPLQRDLPRRARARRGALRLRLLLDGLRARARLPDARGLPGRVPRAAVGLRLLEADRRGLLPRGARRARTPVHDLPPVQRLRARGDARSRAGHRPRGTGPHPQVAGADEAAAHLRHRRAHAHADPRRRHRRRDRHRGGTSGRAQRGLQHLGERGADGRPDRRAHLGGMRQRSRRPGLRAPADLRGRRRPALAVGREGEDAAGLGVADRPSRGDRPDGRVASRAGGCVGPM
ncbi:MAG: UDP-glucose 4-epimerase, partial [uncultured Solirubrobacteraceae bacterium]